MKKPLEYILFTFILFSSVHCGVTTTDKVSLTPRGLLASISIESPVDEETVSGTVNVTAKISGNIVGVQFQLDGADLGSETLSAPYSISLATSKVENGTHFLSAIGRRASGKLLRSERISIVVENIIPDTEAPSIRIVNPIDDSSVVGSIAIKAEASDNEGVVGVQFFLNGVTLGNEVTVAPFSIPWDTTGVPNENYRITAVARDAAGNNSTSDIVQITVSNPDTVKPLVRITAPAIGAIISGIVTVSAEASDNVGVATVHFLIDGMVVSRAITAPPYSIQWDTSATSVGAHLLTARATDLDGNQSISDRLSFNVVQPPDVSPPIVSMKFPNAGTPALMGTVNLTVDVSDNVAVVGVQYFLNGSALGEKVVIVPDYPLRWNTLGVSNGTYTVSAKAYDAAGNSTMSSPIQVTVSNNTAPTVASPASANPSLVTGTTAALSVLGADDGGEANLKYVWTASGPAPVAFSVNSVNAAKNSVATFSGAGTYTFQVTILDAGGLSVARSITVRVTQTVTTIVVAPNTVTLGVQAIQQFNASARDQFGKVVTAPTYTWTLLNGSSGTLSSTGIYTAPPTSGTATVKVAVGTVFGTATAITMGVPTLAINPAATLNAPSGNSADLSVLGTDGGAESHLIYTWSVTQMPPGAPSPVFTINGTNAAKNTTIKLFSAGTYRFSISISNSIYSATFVRLSLVVSPILSSLFVSPGNLTLANGMSYFFTATANDQFGDPMPIQPEFTWTSSGLGTLNAGALYTAPLSGTGSATIQATAGGLTASANVTTTNSTYYVMVPAQVAPNPVTGRSANISVLGAIPAGESTLTYQWSVISAPAGAVAPIFSANGTNAAKNSTVTFGISGNYTLLATIRNSSGTSLTSSIVVVVSQIVSSLSLSPTGSVRLTPSATQPFAVTAKDQFGNVMTPQPVLTWRLSAGSGVLSGTGQYTAPSTSGYETIHVSVGNLSTVATVIVGSKPVSIATPAAARSNPVYGTTVNLSVLGATTSAGGESGLSYGWRLSSGEEPTYSDNYTNTAKNTTATFKGAGNYTFEALIYDENDEDPYVESSVNVAVYQTVTSLTLTPNTATVSNGRSQPFTATVIDQFGNRMKVQPGLSWRVSEGSGTVSPNGVYTAPTSGTGTATIMASAGGVSQSATVTIVNSTFFVERPATATPSSVTGRTTNLTVFATDVNSSPSSLRYRWTVTGMPLGVATPTFSDNDSNSAQNTTALFSAAGTYSFLATVTNLAGLSVTSPVTATVILTGGTFNSYDPENLVLANSETHQYSVVEWNQFNSPMNSQPTLIWTLTSGSVGSVNSSGLYSAPASGTGTATVQCWRSSTDPQPLITFKVDVR